MFSQIKQPCDEAAVLSARENKTTGSSAKVFVASGGWVLAATILASSMTFIDGTVVNVALPVLQQQLSATTAQAQWIVESYALALSALILVGGALGDKYGRRRIFNFGIVVFTAASLVCGLVSDINQLIFARAAQGIGAALLVPGSLAIISATFDKKNRAKAIGTWSGFTAIAAGFGPVLGGWLIDNFSWRWIFYINLPLAVVILLISFWRVPESRDEEAVAGKLDWSGAILATVALSGIVYGLIESNNLGFNNLQVLISLITGAAALIAFLFVERRSRNPMMPLDLFKSKTFSGANLLTLFLYAALGGIFFFLPFNLIQVQGYSATAAGAALVPFVLIMFLLSRPASGLIDRYGAKLPLVVGPVIAGIGFALFAFAPTNANYWLDFFPAILVMSLGMTASVAPLTTIVTGAVEERHAGIASGINNAVSRTASLLAIAAFGIVMLTVFSRNLDSRMNELNLPPEARAELNEQRFKLAGAQISGEFDEPTRIAVKQIVDDSFVAGFRIVALGAAALAFLGALCAWIFIEGKMREASKNTFVN